MRIQGICRLIADYIPENNTRGAMFSLYNYKIADGKNDLGLLPCGKIYELIHPHEDRNPLARMLGDKPMQKVHGIGGLR